MNSILLTHDSTNNKIRPLESDTNGKLHISDSVAQSSLASIATNTNGNGSVLSDMLLDSNAMKTSLQLLDNAISGNQVQVDIVSSSSTLDVSDSTAHSTLSAIASSVAGTLTVTDSAISTSNSTVFNAVTISDASNLSSTSVDVNESTDVCIFGNASSNAGSIVIQVSHDDISYYSLPETYVHVDSSTGDFGKELKVSARYIRLYKANDSGSSEVVSAHVSYKK